MVKNGKFKIENEHRLTRLEEGQIRIEASIEEIRDNHLLHIKEDISGLKSSIQRIDIRMAYWVGGASVLWAGIQYFISRL